MPTSTSFILPRERVLFIGDAITDAFRKPNEINIAPRLGCGYAMMIAAHLMAARPADDLRFKNRGANGHRLVDLEERLQTDCLDLAPSVLSILIGGGAEDDAIEKWAHDYKTFLEKTREALPEVRFVLCEPFALSVGETTPEHLAKVRARQEAVNELADEFESICVPFGSVFEAAAQTAPPEHWLFDGIQPTAAGHWIMAGAWLEAVGELG